MTLLSSVEAATSRLTVETMRTLIVCRGPIAFEALQIYQQRHWQSPHVIVSSKEWIADLYRAAPWIAGLPHDHVHYVQEYDDIEAILDIARSYQIDAVYPGYGFLAENAVFAERVEQAGLRFIGPTPETLRAVGDKDAAIALARQLEIPTVPGDDSLIAYAHQQPQEATLAETVRRTLNLAQRYPGYPVRLKHPAGGGGKGQRVLPAAVLQTTEASAAIRDALTKIWSEMGVSPGGADSRKGVLIELNLPRPLHWEVQVLGDGATVVHFAARDCSLQNQGYQKFIEVALHPQAIDEEIRRCHPQTEAARIGSLQRRKETLERICAEAVRLAQAVHLRGAATVEFLLDEQHHHYFLEVNPRIQVEHGVTEGIALVHGKPLSLVEWQQRIAAGEKLSFQQTDITFQGDAIEIRLNAWHEDLSPVLGGVVQRLRLHVPEALQESVRVDASGLLQRHHPWIVPSYDANFALIIVHAPNRQETLARLLLVLETYLEVQGNVELQTNLFPVIGILTLMHALPPETEFRTDTSLLWMAMAAVVVTQKHAVLAALPEFPRRPATHDQALLARLLRVTLEAALDHPSRLLSLYLQRLQHPASRPITALEVLWELAALLRIPLYQEEQQQGEALRQVGAALWQTLEAAPQRLVTLVQAATRQEPVPSPAFQEILAPFPEASRAAVEAELRYALGWLGVEMPALTILITALEHTQLHRLLTVNTDLSLTRPAYLQEEITLTHLQHVLSHNLRPALLRHGELLSPMEATIYHSPEPGAPPFVEVGEEIKVGQTLALLEAMKMFTELPSPVEGVLLEILVENGQGVKTATPLFRIATQDDALDTADVALPHVLTEKAEARFGLIRAEAPPALPH